jgi:hypothetical protein
MDKGAIIVVEVVCDQEPQQGIMRFIGKEFGAGFREEGEDEVMQRHLRISGVMLQGMFKELKLFKCFGVQMNREIKNGCVRSADKPEDEEDSEIGIFVYCFSLLWSLKGTSFEVLAVTGWVTTVLSKF